jgi:NOL1/NOP2/fmu family ribosome biogenesis protein
MKNKSRTIEVTKSNFTYVITAKSTYLIGYVSGYGKTYFQAKLKHSNEGIGFGKMTKNTLKQIIQHTEENAKFFA